MPKMKTRRSVAKRFKMTASGKLKMKKSNLRHILSKDSSKSKRLKRKVAYVSPSDLGPIKRCLCV